MRLLLSVCLLVTSQLITAEPNDTTALDKMTIAYGGQNKILQTAEITQEGITHSHARNVDGKLTRKFSYPDFMQLEIAYNEHPELRELRGTEAKADGAPANPAFRAAVILQAARLMLPQYLVNHRNELSNEPSENPSLTIYKLNLPENMTVFATIERDTGHIIRSEGMADFSGMTMSFATDYDDFRVIDGRTVAFKEKHYAMGAERGYSTLNKVEFSVKTP